MSERIQVSKRFLVLSALALVVALGGSLGLRVLGTDARADQSSAPKRAEVSSDSQFPGPPAPANVPDPLRLDPLTAELARWCLEHEFDMKDYFGES